MITDSIQEKGIYLPDEILKKLHQFEFVRFKRELAPSCLLYCTDPDKENCNVYQLVTKLNEQYPNFEGLLEEHFLVFLQDNPDIHPGFIELYQKVYGFVD